MGSFMGLSNGNAHSAISKEILLDFCKYSKNPPVVEVIIIVYSQFC